MPPNDMPQPGFNVPSLGPNTNPLPPVQPQISQERLRAENLVDWAKALKDAQLPLSQAVDNLRRAGKSWEDITKATDQVYAAQKRLLGVNKESVDAMQKFWAGGMSFEKIKAMPLKDLGGNLDALVKGFVGLNAELLTVGTAGAVAAASIKFVVDALGSMNKTAQIFSLGQGNVSAAAKPSFEERQAGIKMRAGLLLSGVQDTEQQTAVMSMISKLTGVSGPQGVDLVTNIGNQSRLMQTDPTIMAQRQGMAMRSGEGPGAFTALQNVMRDAAKHLGTSASQLSEEQDALFMSSRSLGVGLKESADIAIAFQGALQKGILTIGELANMDPARKSFMQMAQTVQMAKAAGVNIPGVTDQKDIVAAVGHIYNAKPKERDEMMLQMLKGTVSGLTSRIGAGASGDRLAGFRSIATDIGVPGAPEGVKNALRMGMDFGRPKATIDTTELMRNNQSDAAVVAQSGRSWGESAEMMTKMGLLFGEHVINFGKLISAIKPNAPSRVWVGRKE